MGHTGRSIERRRASRGFVVAVLVILGACGGGEDAPIADEPAAEPAADADSETADDAGGADSIAVPGLVTPEQGAQLAGLDSMVVLDVRTPGEYDEGHLADADVLLDFNAGEFAAGVADLDPDAEYFVYCRSGNRSGQAVAIMRDLGFENVWDLSGGILAWEAAGLPVDR